MLDDLKFEKEKQMVRVLVIGYAPDAVDFADPAMPPGLTEAIVADAIKKDVQSMQDQGWDAEHLLFERMEACVTTFSTALRVNLTIVL